MPVGPRLAQPRLGIAGSQHGRRKRPPPFRWYNTRRIPTTIRGERRARVRGSSSGNHHAHERRRRDQRGGVPRRHGGQHPGGGTRLLDGRGNGRERPADGRREPGVSRGPRSIRIRAGRRSSCTWARRRRYAPPATRNTRPKLARTPYAPSRRSSFDRATEGSSTTTRPSPRRPTSRSSSTTFPRPRE